MALRHNTPRIFVSYARSDEKDLTREMRRRLAEDHGFRLWQDLADMESGKDCVRTDWLGSWPTGACSS